jgi:hypothetical protein
MAPNRAAYEYAIEVVRTDDAVGFGRREVSSSHLESAREQTIFSAQRQGVLGSDPGSVCVAEEPVFLGDGQDQISGVKMAVGARQQRVELQFGLALFDPMASVVTRDLLEAEQLAPNDHVTYRVFARPARPAAPADGVAARVVREPLNWAEGRLDPWLAVGQATGSVDESDYPLFILEREVLKQAQTFSWRGREQEGGCWLVGNLLRQAGPEQEIFGVIHTVLEADGMNHGRFGLEFSSETFLRLEARMEKRRNRFGRAGELVMGFFHSHPFLPSELYGHDACTGCKKRADCSLSSAFLSTHDARFHAAMFGRAPYAVQFVLGLSPREEFELGAYCLDRGQFRSRGFYRVTEPPPGILENLK